MTLLFTVCPLLGRAHVTLARNDDKPCEESVLCLRRGCSITTKAAVGGWESMGEERWEELIVEDPGPLHRGSGRVSLTRKYWAEE